MLKNYFTVALRNFLRHKTFSFIHVLGLSIGISASLVIFQIVRYESTFDQFEKNPERIYRVVLDMNFNEMEGHSPAVPAPLAPAIQHEATGVEDVIPVMQFQGDATAKVTVDDGSKSFKKQADIIFTNDDYFKLLPFEWVNGVPQTSLTQPFSVVLTESRARFYFPALAPEAVIGKRIVYNDDLEVFVTGIVKDMDEHSDFSAVEFISYATISKTRLNENFMMNVWNDWMAYSKLYLKLEPGKTPQDVERQLAALLKKYNAKSNAEGKTTMAFKLQPLNDIHFNSRYAGFGQRTAQKPVLYGLLAIATFLLLLGCINFANLSTAQASRRMKEIGIRKSIGSSKQQLVIQFLGETVFLTLIAMVISISLVPLLLDFFSGFTPPGLKFELFKDPMFGLFAFALLLVVSFVSGLYPALVIARYQPSAVLKNQITNDSASGNKRVRKALTVSQFVIAQFFVIVALIVTKQMYFVLHQDMGFRKEAILNFELPRGETKKGGEHSQQLAARISTLPGIELVSRGFLPPAVEGGAFGDVIYNDGEKEIKVGVQIRWGDPNYIKLYSIPLIAGRNVLEGENVNEVLINENYLHEMGLSNPMEALGKDLTMGDGSRVPIVGVMKDFHEGSFHRAIGPIVFQSRAGDFFHIALTPNTADIAWQETIGSIQKSYKEIFPDADFEYSFYDERVAKFYKSEQDTSHLLNWAMGLTILISCLGLLGLVIYTSATRSKEIGIRKIFGATVQHIVMLLSFEFIQLVIIAFVIAAPLAAWAMTGWLENFSYHTTMSWWVFAMAGLILIAAALLTLSVQTIRTAMENPVKSLRNE